MKRYILGFLFVITILNLSAQIVTKKTSKDKITKKIKLNHKSNMDIITMPAFDVNKLMHEDEIDKKLGLPYRFGYAFKVDYNMQNSGSWIKLKNGKVWSLKIISKGAYSINLAYSKFYLPEKSQLYIYNENKTVLQGPFTSDNNIEEGTFSSDLIEGSAIILEYFEPNNINGKPEISISKIVHAYRNLFPNLENGYKTSADCNVDITCPEGSNWQAESNAVAMILIGDTRWCSGCMINNTAQDFTPYFLTANHCIEGQNIENWSFRFQYKSPSCGGGDDYSYYSYYGADLLVNNAVSDFALLELNSRPVGNTGITFAGWSRNTIAPESVVGIHHPNGDVMKISIDNEQPTSELDDTHWFVNNWEIGTTQGGSSGSPLFNADHRIIGQDHGGNHLEPCDPEKGTYYGRFDVSWDNGLSEFLDPGNTGAFITNTIEIPVIIGVNNICIGSNAIFTIQNSPNGSTITWSKSSNLTYVSGQSTNNYTVRANGNGNGWVQANINGATFRKFLWIGKPNQPYEIFPVLPEGICKGQGKDYQFGILNYSSMGYVESFDWDVQPPGRTWDSGEYVNTTINFPSYTSPGRYSIAVSAINQCGQSAYKIAYYDVVDCGTGGLPIGLRTYPNPAVNTLNIEITANKKSKKLNNLKIYDKFMQLKKIKKFKGEKTNIDVSGLTEGVYIIQVKYGKEIINEEFIINNK